MVVSHWSIFVSCYFFLFFMIEGSNKIIHERRMKYPCVEANHLEGGSFLFFSWSLSCILSSSENCCIRTVSHHTLCVCMCLLHLSSLLLSAFLQDTLEFRGSTMDLTLRNSVPIRKLKWCYACPGWKRRFFHQKLIICLCLTLYHRFFKY